MTKANTPVVSLDRALAAKIDADAELDLLRQRLAEERGSLAQAETAARAAGLSLARSGSDADRLASREALALKAEIERTISHLTDILIPEAEAGQTQAAEDLAEARRTACADEVEAECEALAQRLTEEYPDLIARLADLKAAVDQVDARRAEANRDLPAGREPMSPIEHRVRDVPFRPRREVSQEVVSVWCYVGTGEPIPEDRLGEISKTSRDRRSGEDHFILPSRSSQSLSSGQKVELKRLLRVTMEDRGDLVRGARLADMVLPPLRPTGPEPRRWVELRPFAGESTEGVGE